MMYSAYKLNNQVTIYNLDVLLSQFGTSTLLQSGSNCCFLTCIQVFQEAGKVAWYSHLYKNFPQFVLIHTVKGFGIVNKAEVGVFLGEGNGTPLQHSCLENPWTEEPGRLQSMGSLRVGHD